MDIQLLKLSKGKSVLGDIFSFWFLAYDIIKAICQSQMEQVFEERL